LIKQTEAKPEFDKSLGGEDEVTKTLHVAEREEVCWQNIFVNLRN
jgi:hypothetical protein